MVLVQGVLKIQFSDGEPWPEPTVVSIASVNKERQFGFHGFSEIVNIKLGVCEELKMLSICIFDVLEENRFFNIYWK